MLYIYWLYMVVVNIQYTSSSILPRFSPTDLAAWVGSIACDDANHTPMPIMSASVLLPSGYAEECQLPYYDVVPTDPTFEEMKKVVVVERTRPEFPNRWTQSEVSIVGTRGVVCL